jgi:hypothetical protein
MKTVKEVRESFWQFLNEASPELGAMRRSKKRQNDYNTDIRVMFLYYVDNLCKSRQITNELAYGFFQIQRHHRAF